MVQLLLENGANQGAKDSDGGRTALHDAIHSGKNLPTYLFKLSYKDWFHSTFIFPEHFDVAKILIEYRAQNESNHNGKFCFINSEHLIFRSELFKFEYFMCKLSSNFLSLFVSINVQENGKSSKCRSDLNIKDNTGRTALMKVAERGNLHSKIQF